MTIFGVTDEGFAKKNLTDILDEIEDAEKTLISPSLNTLSTSVIGQLNGVFADKVRELQDVAEAVFRAFQPDGASGDAFDNLAAITGAIRLAATKSTVTLTLTGGDPGTIVLAGSVASVTGTGDRFTTLAAATISLVPLWTPSTSFILGDRVSNGGNVYQVIVAGTSASSGGPGGTGAAIVDGTITWRFLGSGTAVIDVAAESEAFGPIVGNSGTITVIETPISGWDDVINVLDATPGRDIETDPAFRLRREELLRVAGAATLEAIRSNVRNVQDVLQVLVFENVTLLTDVNGLPAKSFEAVVDGGADQAIADEIFAKKPVGIETFGTVTKTVVDSQGTSHLIKFSRPTDIDLFVEVEVTVDSTVFGGGEEAVGAQAVRQAIVDEGALLNIGDDVIIVRFRCAPLDVAGVTDVPTIKIDTLSPPVNTGNFAIAIRDRAKFDTSRIVVIIGGVILTEPITDSVAILDSVTIKISELILVQPPLDSISMFDSTAVVKT